MNYIRGAVNAISAPYQYYKDLPPINPSTLTGAIDVIVIQRPTDNGDIELACSPFHVRFGKWQVLRPSEKKVNVTVNGHPIPYNMKIGEAGEAFFVFETDGDVPEDLITSPILQPTRTDEDMPKDGSAVVETMQDPEAHHELRPHAEGGKSKADPGKLETESSEPEYFDLDAQPSKPAENDDDAYKNANTTPRQHDSRSFPAHLLSPANDGDAAKALPSPPPTPARQSSQDVPPEMAEQDRRVDASLEPVSQNVSMPHVEIHHGIAIDAEGYHTRHDRERSDRTVRSSERSATPSPVRVTHTNGTDDVGEVRDDDDDAPTPLITFPPFRAVSEPPLDIDDRPHSHSILPPQTQPGPSLPEYSWEWGAFPQPSPLKSSFNKGSNWPWNKALTKDTPMPNVEEEERDQEHELIRSQSVPPELDGSPAREKRVKELVDEYHGDPSDGEDEEAITFGHGGKLRPSKKDPTTFVLQIEDRRVPFELSIVPPQGVSSEPEQVEERRGRRNRHSQLGALKILGAHDEVEAARIFSCGKIDFETFLQDEDVVHNPGLVIRWAGAQYITRSDGSPLMRSLVSWRNTTLLWKARNQPPRPASPVSDDEPNDTRPISPPLSSNGQSDERQHHRSKSEPPGKPQGKPTSSSWVRWWSRGGRKKNPLEDVERAEILASKAERPELRETASAPIGHDVVPRDDDLRRPLKEIPPVGSAPAYPSSPVQMPSTTVPPVAEPTSQPPPAEHKFAKTLRLTSDQLKALNLKPGANPITFSLSTSGTIACTARIFVWSSTDSIVVSDIDGTITKSDGLGHVFAMIGRDWTHMGVAKLYTDIARNGYKIMYLTSRAIGQADATRGYLKGIKQNDYQLPEGPVIMSPDRLMASLHREVIMRKPEVFKMACLRDIRGLFGEASRNPFYAGFGNRITDALSYRSVNVPSARIFTIDSSGEVKMELLELAGYKSSYIHMTDLVDQMFPPIHRKWTPEFTDFNYWKAPVQEFPLPDLSPPSPALSARSDTSALARLRNFSLGPSRQTSISRKSTSPSGRDETDEQRGKNPHIRQTSISSFEKLSNTLGFSQTASESRRSASPESSSAYDSEDEEGEERGLDADGRRRRRRRSMTSMPGTLDEIHFDIEEYDEEPFFNGEGEVDHVIVEGEAEDEAFDEDILAAGEMQKVPFL